MRINLYRPFADPWRQSMRVYADQLYRHLGELTGPGDALERVTLDGARLDPPLRYWDQYVRYQRRARRARADVHHVLDHGYAHLASAFPRGRAVVTFHDAIPLRSGRATAWTRLALGRGMRRASEAGARVIAVSEASARDAQHFFGIAPSSIDVVPNGVDARFRPPADREALRARLGVRRPLVLIVGHTQPYMNVDGALRAAGRAARAVDLEVVKIGAPLTMEHGHVAIEAGLDGRLRERGIVPDEELRDWYAAADALLYLPSLSGFGLPVLEAMASGTPVIASSSGAVPEIASGAAVLVDPHDAAAAGDALASILSGDRERAALIDSGLERAARFTWRRAAEATLRIYDRVAHGA